MQYLIRTSSGIVTPANNAGILYGAILTSTGSAGNCLFKDGGSGGTSIIQLNLAANDTVMFEFKKPIRFTSDIYATLTNIAYAYILFEPFKAG